MDAAHLTGMADPLKSENILLTEGEEVFLRARVYRFDNEQALIEFDSMQGPYSIRVPLSEVQRVKPDNFPPSRRWTEGDRIVIRGYSGSYPDSSRDRFGTVAAFETTYSAKEHIIVQMDGEEPKAINPDVLAPAIDSRRYRTDGNAS